MEWSKVLSLAGETSSYATQMEEATTASTMEDMESSTPVPGGSSTSLVRTEYASFANFYINTFYCLAIVCMVSVLDR